MDKEASLLADAFIASKEKEYIKVYNLTKAGKPIEEKVVVLVVRATPQLEKAMKEFSVGVHKAVAGPQGMQCPMCSGTGKI